MDGEQRFQELMSFTLLQAVKYLEGMLIQARQAQRKEKKLSAELDELKLDGGKGTTDGGQQQEDKESLIKEEQEVIPGQEGESKTGKDQEGDEKEKDGDGVDNEEEDGGDDDQEEEEEEISIDPRTYCKLGHFHLLLEDYAKGGDREEVIVVLC